MLDVKGDRWAGNCSCGRKGGEAAGQWFCGERQGVMWGQMFWQVHKELGGRRCVRGEAGPGKSWRGEGRRYLGGEVGRGLGQLGRADVPEEVGEGLGVWRGSGHGLGRAARGCPSGSRGREGPHRPQPRPERGAAPGPRFLAGGRAADGRRLR